MQFRYIGEEYTEFFGFKWMTGTVNDVTDEHAVGKLSNSVLFETVEAAEPEAAAAAEDAQPPAKPHKAKAKKATAPPVVETEAGDDDTNPA